MVVSSQAHQVDFERAALSASALDLEQGWFVVLRFDLTEAAFDPTRLDDQTVWKVAEKERCLVAHRLPMLYGVATKKVVQLHGFVRGYAVLVLRRLRANPEVEIYRRAASHLSAQHNVAVPAATAHADRPSPNENFAASGLAKNVFMMM